MQNFRQPEFRPQEAPIDDTLRCILIAAHVLLATLPSLTGALDLVDGLLHFSNSFGQNGLGVNWTIMHATHVLTS